MAITGTESRFQNMKMLVEELEVNGQPVTGGSATPPDASEVSFSSSEGLSATDVAAALDELKAMIDGLG